MTDPALALTVALGCGMLLGVQRERRLGEESNRAAADVRTFALVGLAGGLAGGWAGLRQRPSRSASSRSQRLSDTYAAKRRTMADPEADRRAGRTDQHHLHAGTLPRLSSDPTLRHPSAIQVSGGIRAAHEPASRQQEGRRLRRPVIVHHVR
jgi:hypothetical protein